MTSFATENLEGFFRKLELWRSEQLISPKPWSCDQLAINCLKIATCILDDHFLGKTIAKELSLILDVQEEIKAETELLGAIEAIEKDLEASLRGFSGLMEWILEEAEIRRDPALTIKRVTQLNPQIADSFNRLACAIDVYLELEEAFSLNVPKAAAGIFLIALGDIYGELIGIEQHRSQDVIGDWLQDRVKNHGIKRLYEDSITMMKGSWPPIKDGPLTKELIVVLLCFRAADWQPVKLEEVSQLDRSLDSIGMLGIKPLVDAGFLAMEKSVTDRGSEIVSGSSNGQSTEKKRGKSN